MTEDFNPPSFPQPNSSIRGLFILGLFVVFGILGGLFVWSMIAPLESAVSAPASLSLKGERKKVQHLEGGLVSGIYVSEGEVVKQGQLLLKLDPLRASANFSRFRYQLDQVLARKARLLAELAQDESIHFSGEFLDRISKDKSARKIWESEDTHFHARKASFTGQLSILKQRIEQLKKQIAGLKIRRGSRLGQLEIFRSELVGLRDLFQKGYYPKTKILAMERSVVQLEGFVGSDDAEIARAESAMGETKRQIINVQDMRNEELASELKATESELADLEERLVVASDIVGRLKISAPRSGVVQSLKVHTLGGIVSPGETLMEIAPQNEELVVEAQIATVDIDNIQIGQEAEVRLTGLNLMSLPAVYGRVVATSGDAITEQGALASYYLARIEISDEEKEKLGEVRLTAGMPADVLIKTGERTALEYLLKPAVNAFSKSLNED